MSLSDYYHISSSGKIEKVDDFAGATALLNGDGYVWFDYRKSSREDLSELIEPLGLHPLSVEDCTDETQVPKMDDFPNYTFIVFNALYYKEGSLLSDEVNLFIGKNFLVSVSGYTDKSPMPLTGIEGVIERSIINMAPGPAWMLQIILDHIVDQMANVLDGVETDIDLAEEAILASPAGFDPSGLIYLRRNLLALRKSLFHEREILVKLIRSECVWIPKRAIAHYRDIYDHLSNFLEMTEGHRDNVTSLMELYASMLNNQMARDSNQTNFSVRRLTLITTIFMPLTLLAGVFGMSEWTMMTGPENWHKSYLLFAGIIIAIGAASFILLRWLERKDRKRLL